MGRTLVLMLLVIALTSCGLGSRPSFGELEEMMTELKFPSDWELISEEVVSGHCLNSVESCPRINRHYEVEATSEFAEVAAEMFLAVGMETETLCDEPIDGCAVLAFKDNINVGATVVDVEGARMTVSLLIR